MTKNPERQVRERSRLGLAAMLAATLLVYGCGAGEGVEDHSGHEDEARAENDAAHSGHEDGDEWGAAGRESEGREEAESETPVDRIRLEEEQRASLDLQLAPAEAGSARGRIRAPATVLFDPDTQHLVGPKVEARVVEVFIDLGDRVDAGTPLARLDSVALGEARAALITARAAFETARAELARESELAEQDITSEAELARVRARHAEALAAVEVSRETLRVLGLSEAEIADSGTSDVPLSRMVLLAPMHGLVQRRDLIPGELLGANETPIQLVQPDRFWIIADVSEQDVAGLEIGDRLTFRSRSLPGALLEAKVDWISAQLDRESRTVRVRAVIDGPDRRLRDGLYGQVEIESDSDVRWPMVPVDAVQEIEGSDRVFVPGDEPATFVARPVELGAEGDGRIEVRSGLAIGDPVVVRGAFDLMSALTARTRSAAHNH